MDAHYVIEDGLSNVAVTETATVVINIISECVEEELEVYRGAERPGAPETTDIKILYGIDSLDEEYSCGSIVASECESWSNLYIYGREFSNPDEFCELSCSIVGDPTPQVLENIDYGTPDYDYLFF